ncbi:hypothetical protein N9N67_11380 [Bacteriovoracaceae bacterium]|nr:hypothetical protein [Bacteriovoracaceae bacterium]
MKSLISKNWPLLLCVFCFLFISYLLGYLGHGTENIFYSDDSLTYIKWFEVFFGQASMSDNIDIVALRTFGFPLMMGFTMGIHPVFLIIIHFILWIFTIKHMMEIISALKLNRTFTISLGIFSGCLIDPMILIFHGLSETLSYFLIIYSTKLIMSEKLRWWSLPFLGYAVVVRPNFIYLFLVTLILLLFKDRNKIKEKFIKILPPLALGMLFPMVQLLIMINIFSVKTISFIDVQTLNDYFLADMDRRENSGKLAAAYKVRFQETRTYLQNTSEVGQLSTKVKKELKDRLLNSPSLFFKTFWKRIRKNGTISSNLIDIYQENKAIKKISRRQNTFLFYSALISVLISTILLVIQFRSIVVKVDILFLFLNAHTALSILSSGFSFWQGSRFTIPIMFTSPILWAILIIKLRNFRKSNVGI